MSTEQIQAFVEKFFSDDDLRDKFMKAANREEWLDTARKAGFSFSTGEFADVLNLLAGTWMGKDQVNAGSKGTNGSDNKKNNFMRKLPRPTFLKS